MGTTDGLVGARPVTPLLVHLDLEGITSFDGANIGVGLVVVASNGLMVSTLSMGVIGLGHVNTHR